MPVAILTVAMRGTWQIATSLASDAKLDRSHTAPPFDAFLALRIDVRSGAKTMFSVRRREAHRAFRETVVATIQEATRRSGLIESPCLPFSDYSSFMSKLNSVVEPTSAVKPDCEGSEYFAGNRGSGGVQFSASGVPGMGCSLTISAIMTLCLPGTAPSPGSKVDKVNLPDASVTPAAGRPLSGRKKQRHLRSDCRYR